MIPISDTVSSETDKAVHQDSQPLESASYGFLGAFAKLRKAFIGFVMSVLFFLLGDSSASEFYMPTFRNTKSVPSS